MTIHSYIFTNNSLFATNDTCYTEFSTFYVCLYRRQCSVYWHSLVLRIATEEDGFIPEGRLFHKKTILLKYESLKREVLHKFGRRKSPELEQVE
jgi:hypothetical protein